MSPTVIRAAGLATTIVYAVMIGWLFVQQPRTLAQVAGGVSDSIGAYRIDDVAFADGLRFFRADQFAEARAAFQRADPAQRDARTQFYIAYAYYRQGWGRVYHDDPLYRLGLEHVKMAIALAPNGRLVLSEPDLGMQSADELRAELERGLTREAEDFNPLKLFNERK